MQLIYSTEVSLFSTQSPSTLMHLSRLGASLEIPSRYKSGSCMHNHSPTANSTSSLLWNRQPLDCCHLLHVTATSIPTKSYHLSKNKILVYRKRYRLGNLTYWTSLVHVSGWEQCIRCMYRELPVFTNAIFNRWFVSFNLITRSRHMNPPLAF
jgi:hypothetical protein